MWILWSFFAAIVPNCIKFTSFNYRPMNQHKQPKQTFLVHERSSVSSGEEQDFIREEVNLVRKLDRYLLTYVCLGYFIKSLDASNVSNAYVSGMKETLNMTGNQYNLLSTYYTIGYVAGQIVSQLIICYIRPSVWLPLMEVSWSVLVVSLIFTYDLNKWYVIRFAIGLMEALAFPGLISILGTWYPEPKELVWRSSIFQSFSLVALIFGGALQAALYKYWDGFLGIAAWKWIFIIDGIIGIPIAVFGTCAIPDEPGNTKALWLTSRDQEVLIERMQRYKRLLPIDLTHKGILKDIFREILTSWPVYLFSGLYICHAIISKALGFMNLWLKWTGDYTVEEVNIYPTLGSLMVGAFTLYSGRLIISNKTSQTKLMLLLLMVTLAGSVILLATPKKNHNFLVMLGWYLLHAESCVGTLIMTWINQTVSYSYEQRLLIIGIVQTLSFFNQSWVPLVAFDLGEAPNYKYGYQVLVTFSIVEILGVVTVQHLINRDTRRNNGV